MEALGALTQRVRGIERTADANGKAINDLAGKQGNQQTEIAVIIQQHQEIREDIGELKGQLRWIIRGIAGMIGTGLIVAATVLAAVIASHG